MGIINQQKWKLTQKKMVQYTGGIVKILRI